jgi:hypothetical protein
MLIALSKRLLVPFPVKFTVTLKRAMFGYTQIVFGWHDPRS